MPPAAVDATTDPKLAACARCQPGRSSFQVRVARPSPLQFPAHLIIRSCVHHPSVPTSSLAPGASAQGIAEPASAAAAAESPEVQATINALSLVPHVEGGYYVLTDSSPTLIPSPYPRSPLSEQTLALVGGLRPGFDPAVRHLSSSIFYYLTPGRPTGSFHRNRSRIVHTWHRGRGRYVLIHPDGRVESFVVGPDVERGEKLQWAVEGGVWKASYLLEPSHADGRARSHNEGLLISETVVPGFEYADHEFLSRQRCAEMLSESLRQELEWLVKH